MAATRQVNEELASGVNNLLIDLLAHNANVILLKALKESSERGEDLPAKPLSIDRATDLIEAVDGYFKVLESNATPASEASSLDPDTAFRIRLLQIISLYMFRCCKSLSTGHAQSTQALRDVYKTYTMRYQERAKHVLASKREGFGKCVCLAAGLDASSPESFQRNDDPTAVLFLMIPGIIELTLSRANLAPIHTSRQARARAGEVDARNRRSETGSQFSTSPSEWKTTEGWLKLMAEMMLQSSLEQRFVTGAFGASSVLDPFSWGPVDTYDLYNSTQDVPMEDEALRPYRLNQAFILETEQSSSGLEADTWNYLRLRYIEELIPPEASSPEETKKHFERVARRHPRRVLDEALHSFLSALLESLDPPLLLQIEKSGDGTPIVLDGVSMSPEDCKKLRWAFGLDRHEA
ncbi:MAG: hypothetical protein M1828_003595 [Chrysothrix sp. TS-e1954]|nr:MAG: hypothetical protein M1828_003595 [Chrysothrix sp. TS-e1954]